MSFVTPRRTAFGLPGSEKMTQVLKTPAVARVRIARGPKSYHDRRRNA